MKRPILCLMYITFKKSLWIFLLVSFLGYGSELSFDSHGPNPVGHIKLEMDRPIDQSTYLYVKFALEHFRKIGARFVVLELDTPGGEVFAAQKIAHLLHESDVKYEMPVVAYLNNWAISAGAMLAYSCRYIAISPSASMGAAEPVTMQSGGMESAPEKINSALRAEFANLASLYGRDPLLAQAMVDKDLIVVKRGGEIAKLDEPSDFRPDTDEMVSPKGKLLTLSGAQIKEFGIADFTVPFHSNLFEIAPFNQIPDPELIPYANWKIRFFSFLSHPAIASFLMMGLMLCFYLEIQSGGFGWPACLGLACLGLVLLSNFAVYTVDWLEIILIAAGAALLVIEIIFLPTFGIAAALGILLVLGGLFAMGQPNIKEVSFSFDLSQWNLAAYSLWNGLGWFSGTLLATFAAAAFSTRKLLPKFKRLMPREIETIQAINKWPDPGSCGTVFSTCRPAGQVLVEGAVYEAASEWGFIDKGEKVIISRIESNRVIVRPKG